MCVPEVIEWNRYLNGNFWLGCGLVYNELLANEQAVEPVNATLINLR
jgi:hypothetical protein